MNNEEKILEILGKHGEMLERMKVAQEEMKAAQEEMKAAQEEMRGDISEMQATLTRVAVTQEGVVLPKLQLLYEGHGTIMEAMDALAPKSRVEALEDDVAMMKDVIKLMRQEIAELKKAQ